MGGVGSINHGRDIFTYTTPLLIFKKIETLSVWIYFDRRCGGESDILTLIPKWKILISIVNE